jgi:hypothetical protein
MTKMIVVCCRAYAAEELKKNAKCGVIAVDSFNAKPGQ